MRCASGSETHDLASTHGLVSAVVAILGLVCGGLCHLGTVCTSFNFVNSGTHTRSISFPLGWRQDLSYVEDQLFWRYLHGQSVECQYWSSGSVQ